MGKTFAIGSRQHILVAALSMVGQPPLLKDIACLTEEDISRRLDQRAYEDERLTVAVAIASAFHRSTEVSTSLQTVRVKTGAYTRLLHDMAEVHFDIDGMSEVLLMHPELLLLLKKGQADPVEMHRHGRFDVHDQGDLLRPLALLYDVLRMYVGKALLAEMFTASALNNALNCLADSAEMLSAAESVVTASAA